MGLYAYVSGDDLGLIPSVSGTGIQAVDSDANGENNMVENDELVEITIEVDYSGAFEEFASAFYDVATQLVPVDTGYLMSTISSSSDDWSMQCEASAHYAQYVQFGTWKMAEQPYFRPALEQAWSMTSGAFRDAYDAAVEELQNELAALDGGLSDETGGSGGGGGFLGGLLGGLLGAIFTGLMSIFSDMISGGQQITYDKGSSSVSFGGGGLSSLVEIT